MRLKNNAKQNFINTLNKENLDIDLYSLSEKELKSLYVKWQKLRQNYCNYQALKNKDFEEILINGNLAYVTFKGTPGVRPLTLKEYLMLEEFVDSNPTVYPLFKNL